MAKKESLFLGLLKAFESNNDKKDNDMNSWEKDAMKDDEYEPYNFEEEELEEDDYYYDDDK